jgi:hypothetical protein
VCTYGVVDGAADGSSPDSSGSPQRGDAVAANHFRFVRTNALNLSGYSLFKPHILLKILDAIQFQKVFTEGGRTKPWLIQVAVNGERRPYVAKIFTTDEVDDENTVAREVFGSVLAGQFDLSTPDIALVRFTKSFVNTLPNEIRQQLLQKDDRLKFGSAYLPNTQLFVSSKKIHIADLKYNTASIYAFDTIINNKDRGLYKPNILVSNASDDYYLIDHERAFKHITKLNKEVQIEEFSEVFREHLFYQDLKSRKDKRDLFSNFHASLKCFNTNILDKYQDVLSVNDLGHSNFDEIKSYLVTLKKKYIWVEKMLYNTLSE